MKFFCKNSIENSNHQNFQQNWWQIQPQEHKTSIQWMFFWDQKADSHWRVQQSYGGWCQLDVQLWTRCPPWFLHVGKGAQSKDGFKSSPLNKKLIHLHLMVDTVFANDITNSLINFLFACIPVLRCSLFPANKSLFFHAIWNVKDNEDDIVLANLHCICDCNQWKNLWHKSDWSFLTVSFKLPPPYRRPLWIFQKLSPILVFFFYRNII